MEHDLFGYWKRLSGSGSVRVGAGGFIVAFPVAHATEPPKPFSIRSSALVVLERHGSPRTSENTSRTVSLSGVSVGSAGNKVLVGGTTHGNDTHSVGTVAGGAGSIHRAD